jgi:hypothetical protein
MLEEDADEEYVDPSKYYDPNFFKKHLKKERLGPYSKDPLQPQPFGDLPDYTPPLRTIPVNLKAEVTPAELSYAGQFLRVNDNTQLSQLPDDTYIYLIDKYERVMISSRAPDQGIQTVGMDTKYMASHRSLLNQFKILDPSVEIIAAGEFRITHGVTTALNNKSNTFRGDGTALRYAEKKLKIHGLPVRENTQRVDYAETKPISKHLNDAEEAKALVELRGNPRYKLIRDLFDELYEKFPATSSEPAGMLSKSEIDKVTLKLSNELMSRKAQGNITPGEEGLYSNAVFLMGFLKSEGLVHAGERFQTHQLDEVSNTVRLVQKTIENDPIRIELLSTRPLALKPLPESPVKEDPRPVAQPLLHPRQRVVKVLNESEFEKQLVPYSTDPEFAHHISRALLKVTDSEREAFRRTFILGESNEELQREMTWSTTQSAAFKSGGLRKVKDYFESEAPDYSRNLRMLVKGQDMATLVAVEKEVPLIKASPRFKKALKDELEGLTGDQLKILKSFLTKEPDEQAAVVLGLKDVSTVKQRRGFMVNNILNHFKKDHPELIDELKSFFGRRAH